MSSMAVSIKMAFTSLFTADLNAVSSSQAESSGSFGGPPTSIIREMAHQLDSWRSLLPQPLQWTENAILDLPGGRSTTPRPEELLFSTTGPRLGPIGHRHNLDIVNAQLRTRFYYARFMLFRPFIYKALHSPKSVTTDDADCCALAIESACLWPMSMAPPKDKKRLVPHQFTWTQNMIGVLLILRMTQEEGVLKQLCEGRINRDDLDSTIVLLLNWVKDVKQVDGIAEWSWNILEPLFAEV